MTLKLFSFIVRTRFSRPLLVALLIILLYSLFLGFVGRRDDTFLSSFSEIYVSGILTALMIFMVFMGGVAVMKSDMDFLFPLPLGKWEKTFALFFSQFLATGISFIFAVGYVMPYIGITLYEKELVLFGLVLLSIFVTAISSISHRLNNSTKAALSSALGGWALLPFIGINYSFTSLFTGNPVFAVLMLLLLDIPVCAIAFRELANAEIGVLKSTSRTAAVFRRSETFTGASPVRAIYRKNINEVNFTGRIGIGGSVRVRISRIPVVYLVAGVSIISIIYYVLAKRQDSNFNLVVLFGTIYIGIFASLLLSQEVLSHERAWLGFTSMPVQHYWKHLCTSKTLQSMVILSPIALTDLLLYFEGIRMGLGAALFILITVPLSVPLIMYFNARISWNQIIDTEFMSGQQNLRQVASLIPIFFLSILSIVSVLSILFAVALAVFAFAAFYSLLGSKTLVETLVSRLAERGYV